MPPGTLVHPDSARLLAYKGIYLPKLFFYEIFFGPHSQYLFHEGELIASGTKWLRDLLLPPVLIGDSVGHITALAKAGLIGMFFNSRATILGFTSRYVGLH